MLKDDLLYLVHMLDTARRAYDKVQDIDRDVYDSDENLRLALAHLVQVIGEAARRVSPQTCTAHPDILWREIIGMRHKIVHDYMSLDEDILWQVVTEDLPPLIEALERLVPPEETE
jgi:uncharacterized protein with HEPN domain